MAGSGKLDKYELAKSAAALEGKLYLEENPIALGQAFLNQARSLGALPLP